MADIAILAAVIAGTAVIGWWWRRRDGHVRPAEGHVADRLRDELGVPASGWLLLLFTAPACQPCVAAKQVLATLAAARSGVHLSAVDVGDRLDLARRHHVLRAPSVLLIDERGDLHARVSGVPDPDELAAILDGKSQAA